MRGYWKTASWLDKLLTGILRYFPAVAPTSSVLGRINSLGYQFETLDSSLHSPLVRGYVVKAKPPSDELVGAGALLKCLLKLGEDQESWSSHTPDIPLYQLPGTTLERGSTPWLHTKANDEQHLERSGRPKRVSIKLGWSPPY